MCRPVISPRSSRSSKDGRLASVRFALVAGACALALALSACPARDRTPSPAAPTTPAGRPGGTLRIAVADDAGALDPQLAAEPGAFGLIRATQRGLTAFPWVAPPAGATPVPDLAAGPPEVSADGLTYTFRLRPGAQFGPPASRALTAGDVVAGLERAVRLRAAGGAFEMIAGASSFLAGKAGSVSGLSAPDAGTVRMTLVKPVNDVLWMLAIPAASAVPAGLGTAVSPRDISASGPYRLDAWEPGVRMRLVRNERWKGGADPVRRGYVDAIEVRVGPAADGADLAGEGVRGSGPVENVTGGCMAYLFMNTRAKPLDAVQVRKGIALAIDRANAAEALARAAAARVRPARTLLAPATSDDPAAAADPQAARRTIGRAFSTRIGFERRGPDAAGDTAMGEAIIRMLAAAGVTATPLLGPGAIGPSAYDQYERGSAPMGVARWCPDWPGRAGRVVLSPLLGAGGTANYSRTADPELDRLIGAAATMPAAGAGALDRAWGDAERRALSLTTIVPLAFYDDAALVSKRVGGFVAHPLFTRGDPANVWLVS